MTKRQKLLETLLDFPVEMRYSDVKKILEGFGTKKMVARAATSFLDKQTTNLSHSAKNMARWLNATNLKT